MTSNGQIAPALRHEDSFDQSAQSGVNQSAPARSPVPAPVESHPVDPDHVQPPRDGREMLAEQPEQIKSHFKPEPQPVVSTKALEATSYSAHKKGDVDAPYMHDHDTVGKVTHDTPNGHPIDDHYGSAARDDRHAPAHDDHEASGGGTRPVTRDYAGKAADKERSTPSERSKSSKTHSSDMDDETIQEDEHDPDARYRVVKQETMPFEDEQIHLTKEEREAEKKERKLRRRQKLVKDPVTGQEIWIQNFTGPARRYMDNEGVVAPKFATLKDQDSAAKILSHLHKIPFKDDKTNILFYPMEVPEWKDLRDEAISSIFQWGYIMVFVLAATQIGLSFMPARYAMWLNTFVAVVTVITVRNRIRTLYNDSFANSEKVRGEISTVQSLPESVEWLNNIVRTIWPTINPEFFAAPIDLLEDVLQKQVPSIVHTVKVGDLDIGAVPLRITSMRFLPDNGAPRGDEDAAGEYVNLEVSFGYRSGKAGRPGRSKAQSIHLLIWFLVGLRNVLGIPIPVWVEVHGIIGKARVRIQLLPDPPFVKNMTLTLLGMPKVDLKTIPITSHFINVMNLPFVDQIVAYAIKTVAKDFIAPRSYTLDLSKLMIGDDVKKETAAIGVLMVALHRADNLPRTDHRPGKSKIDPYLTMQFSHFGKTTYSTRVIKQDRNPVWEETCFLPILPGNVKAAERVRVNLWDSDRLTADDHVGRVEIDLTNLVINPGKFERRVDHIVGTRKGKLHWSVGFFGKKEIPDIEPPRPVEAHVPPALQHDPAFAPEQAKMSVDSRTEQVLCRSPPDFDYPGIVSIQIHQINELGITNPKEKLHTRNGRARDFEVEQGKEDDSGSAPSSYCCVMLNDELVYKTRTRAYTNRPIFNASFERFLRSARDSRIRIAVRDQRFREEDPIIGILPLSLSEELENQGQVTRWYPLSEGIGFGYIRVSILFRNIKCQLQSPLQGWNLGTLRIFSIKAVLDDPKDGDKMKDCSLKIDTTLGRQTISSLHAKADNETLVHWEMPHPLAFPIRRRHATSLSLEMLRGGVPFTKKGLFSGVFGASLIALGALDDGKRSVVEIPIFQPDDHVRFKQNTLSQTDGTLRRIGHIECACTFVPGMSESHRKFNKRSNDLAQTYESWEAERDFFERLFLEQSLEEKLERRKARKVNAEAADVNSDDVSENGTMLTSPTVDEDDDESMAPPNGNILLPESRRVVSIQSAGGHDKENRHAGHGHRATNGHEEDESWSDSSDSDYAEALDPGERRKRRNSASKAITAPREFWEQKQRERREMYRRHHGIMQQKPARTVVWVKNGLQKGMSKFSRALSLNREDNIVEREV